MALAIVSYKAVTAGAAGPPYLLLHDQQWLPTFYGLPTVPISYE